MTSSFSIEIHIGYVIPLISFVMAAVFFCIVYIHNNADPNEATQKIVKVITWFLSLSFLTLFVTLCIIVKLAKMAEI